MTREWTKVTVSCRWFLTSAFGFIVVLVATLGTASADVLVLDVCMKQCTEDDWRAIDNMRRVLEREINNTALVASVDDMISRLGNSVPFPGIDDPNLTVQQLTKELQDGIEMWTGGDHEAATESLKKPLAEALVNPALVADDATLRSLVQKAYIARSVSLFRLKRTKDKDKKQEAKDPRVIEAKHAMEDMVRMTPEPSIRDTWGTNPDYVFQLSRDDLMARGTGTLSIQINDPSVVFYLHPAGQPHRGAFVGEVFPGIYQVFVIDTLNRCRRYRVEVAPHQHTVLNIDWRRDTKFEAREPRPPPEDGRPWVSRARIGFTFASLSERRREADFASDIATQVPGSLVIVFGRIKWEGKDALMGEIYAPEQPPFRVGVALGTDISAARDLAFFLMTDKPAPHIFKLDVLPWETLSPVRRDDGLPSPAKWFIIGSGAVAIAAGAILYAVDSPARKTAPYGIGFGIVGAVAMGVGFWLGGSSPTGPIVSVNSSHAMIGWAGSF